METVESTEVPSVEEVKPETRAQDDPTMKEDEEDEKEVIEQSVPSSTDMKIETQADAIMKEDEDDDRAEKRAVKQIEFYFDDSNLPYDKFMWTLHTANPEHWVPIATVSSFKRMKVFQPRGIPWIANALKNRSTQLDVDDKLENCRRKHEVKQLSPGDHMARSIYAKGFGEERPTLQEELEDFFSQFGNVRSLRMRRNDETKAFKGSVFVEFDTPETMQSFLSISPPPTWGDSATPLLIYSKQDYCDMKIKEKGLTGKHAENRRQTIAKEGHGGRRFNAFIEMAKAEKKEKKKDKPKPQIFIEFMGRRVKVIDNENVGDEENMIDVDAWETIPKATLRFDGCKGECQWSDVKEPIREHFGRAPFIKFERGDDFGLVGFDRTLTEEDLDYVKEKVKQVGGNEVVWTYADEGSNRAYQIERANAAAQRALGHSTVSTGGGRGRGRGRGNRSRRGGGGRGGGRRSERGGDVNEKAKEASEAQVGDKRQRQEDGGSRRDNGGDAPPVVQSKKPKVESADAVAS